MTNVCKPEPKEVDQSKEKNSIKSFANLPVILGVLAIAILQYIRFPVFSVDYIFMVVGGLLPSAIIAVVFASLGKVLMEKDPNAFQKVFSIVFCLVSVIALFGTIVSEGI